MSEFLIMFREVLEGVLVVGILYTFIVKTGRDHLKKSIINGIIASLSLLESLPLYFKFYMEALKGNRLHYLKEQQC